MAFNQTYQEEVWINFKKHLVNGLGGSYLLYSGMAFNIHTPTINNIVESHTNFTGTCLFLTIPLSPKDDFKITDYLDK